MSQTGHLDVLSSLPANVTDDILIRLPLRDAVRTSILSKRWRYKWRRLPELKLDDSILETMEDSIKFTSIIRHLLTFHVGPIRKFTLSVLNLWDWNTFEKMICFLSRNGIQHLVVGVLFGEGYDLPDSFYACSQLTHLTLENCLIDLPPLAFQGFARLISLELCRVMISSKLLGSVISHSPLLEKLVLQSTGSFFDGVIEINAPMLRSFDFTGNVRSICLKNVPRLAKLSIMHDIYMLMRVEAEACNIVRFFEPLSALEQLHLNTMFFAAGAGEVPARLPFNLNSVKHLRLTIDYSSYLHDFSCALCLIRSFPYLQHMAIQAYDHNDDMPGVECLEVECVPDVNFHHLREVHLQGFIGAKPQMQLIKLLLSKSPVLARMLIDVEPRWAVEKSALIKKKLAELLKFQRASPKAVIYKLK